jgi:hypothetical protein
MTLTPDGTKLVLGCAGVPRNRVEPAAVIVKFPGK